MVDGYWLNVKNHEQEAQLDPEGSGAYTSLRHENQLDDRLERIFSEELKRLPLTQSEAD